MDIISHIFSNIQAVERQKNDYPFNESPQSKYGYLPVLGLYNLKDIVNIPENTDFWVLVTEDIKNYIESTAIYPIVLGGKASNDYCLNIFKNSKNEVTMILQYQKIIGSRHLGPVREKELKVFEGSEQKSLKQARKTA